MSELVEERGRSLWRILLICFVLGVFPILAACLTKRGDALWVDLLQAVGIQLCFGTGLWCAHTRRLNLGAGVAALGLVLPVFGAGMALGHYPDTIWFLLPSVVLAGFAVDTRVVWGVYAVALLTLVSFVVWLPGHPLGTGENTTLVVDAGVLLTGMAFFMHSHTRATLRAQQRADTERAALDHQRRMAEIASNSKSMFLANVSHELRTPLNAIIGYAELIREEADERQIVCFDEDLDRVHSAARHLLTLIDEVLDLTKIEAGRMEVFAERFELEQLLRELIGTMMPLARRQGNALALELEGELPVMHTDRTKLRQVLLNLVSNAAKFTTGGQLRVSARAIELGGRPAVRVAVMDTGMGLDDEALARVFELFVQASASTSREHGGTGLGLPLSRKICALLGGALEATSVPGAGSTFEVLIPAQYTAAGD